MCTNTMTGLILELEKNIDYHKLPRKYLSKNDKLEFINDHYYRVREGEHNDDSEDSDLVVVKMSGIQMVVKWKSMRGYCIR